jgi:protein required for attachment to host cells
MIIDTRHFQSSSALWILIANGQQARVYECAKVLKITPMVRSGNRYYYQESMETKLTPLSNELWTIDQLHCSSRSYNHYSDGNTAMAVHQENPPINENSEELKQRFMEYIAFRLGIACATSRFGKLAIAAPPRMLGALKTHLTPATTLRLVAEIPKELTQYNEHQLLRHMEYILPRVYAN